MGSQDSSGHDGLLQSYAYEAGNDYEALRQSQNRCWAQESVKRGIAHAKEGLYEKALASYEHALEVDPQNADAHVARGAAYANQDLLESAVHEFKEALKLDPTHPNAAKYRDVTQAKLDAKYKVVPNDP